MKRKTNKKQKDAPDLPSQPSADLTDEELQRVVGGKKKDPLSVEELNVVAHVPAVQ
ncbi:MAG TPA: hypothetical protein VKT82_06280 [Ktedonobacterales bacterium]|nr:hypothetical protein [Ktedonobacterales bacterium]